MHHAPMPQGPLAFPLPPLDANGDLLFVGGTVTVLSVDSCLSELPLEDQERLRQIVGQRRRVVTFDSSGLAWLCFVHGAPESADFCLFPAELSLA
jgi:hypothetical protein